jgi:hypothetical protein
MASLERFACGCVGIRVSPALALYLHLCERDASGQPDRATVVIRGCPKQPGTRLNLNSREVDRIESEIRRLMDDGRNWRRVREFVAGAFELQGRS